MENSRNINDLTSQFPDREEASERSDGVWEAKDAKTYLNRYFAIASESNDYVKRFQLRLRSGKTISIPYALLPVIELDNNTELKILTHDLQVYIQGRNLRELESWLSQERIVWIKESPSGKDDGEDIFIANIRIESELFT